MVFLLAVCRNHVNDTSFEATQIWLGSIFFPNSRLAFDLFGVHHSSVCILNLQLAKHNEMPVETTRKQKRQTKRDNNKNSIYNHRCNKNVYVWKLMGFSHKETKLNCLKLVIIIANLLFLYEKILANSQRKFHTRS